jgi:hypothetical protein
MSRSHPSEPRIGGTGDAIDTYVVHGAPVAVPWKIDGLWIVTIFSPCRTDLFEADRLGIVSAFSS